MRWRFRADVVLVSPLPVEEVERALASLVEPPTIRWPWERSRPLRGWIRGRSFQVGRSSRAWRMSALPIVDGTIEPRGDGASIRLSIHRHGFTAVSVGLGLAGGALVSCHALQGMLAVGAPDPILLLPVVATVLYAGWALRAFDREVERAIRIFEPLGSPESRPARPLVRR